MESCIKEFHCEMTGDDVNHLIEGWSAAEEFENPSQKPYDYWFVEEGTPKGKLPFSEGARFSIWVEDKDKIKMERNRNSSWSKRLIKEVDVLNPHKEIVARSWRYKSTEEILREKSPFLITLNWLKKQEACKSGLKWFKRHFGSKGVEAEEVIEELRDTDDESWISWLKPKVQCEIEKSQEPSQDGFKVGDIVKYSKRGFEIEGVSCDCLYIVVSLSPDEDPCFNGVIIKSLNSNCYWKQEEGHNRFNSYLIKATPSQIEDQINSTRCSKKEKKERETAKWQEEKRREAQAKKEREEEAERIERENEKRYRTNSGCIDYHLLKKLGACSDGLNWFEKNFDDELVPQDIVISLLKDSDHRDWAEWLLNKIRKQRGMRGLALGEAMCLEKGTVIYGKITNNKFLVIKAKYLEARDFYEPEDIPDDFDGSVILTVVTPNNEIMDYGYEHFLIAV